MNRYGAPLASLTTSPKKNNCVRDDDDGDNRRSTYLKADGDVTGKRHARQHDTPTFNSEEDDNDVEGGSVGRPGWRNARDADETMLCFIVDYFYERFVLLLSCSHGRCALLRPAVLLLLLLLLLLLVAGLLVASARWLVVACVLRGT